jgi:hypothetical protein
MNAQTVNRQWRLVERPDGMVGEQHFGYLEAPIPTPAEGEMLVRTLYLSFDPAMRAFLNAGPGYAAPQQVGDVMRAGAIAQVVESRADLFRKGDVVFGGFGWQDYAVARPEQGVVKIPPGRPLTDHMSALGGTGLTAYFGLIEVGRPKKGETVVVSGAAGATGSTVVQIAKILGCRAIAIAGGPEKCRWTVEALGADAAIDYKSEHVGQRLAALCPDGIDVYFDNVGGATLDAAIGQMKKRGRIVLCGMIAGYNEAAPAPGPRNLFQLVARSVRMEGFLLYDFAERLADGRRALEAWMDEGRLKAFVDVQEGFENIPRTFLRLFTGANLGKQTLKLADPVPSA